MFNKDIERIKRNPATTEYAINRINELKELKQNARLIERLKINAEIMSLNREIAKRMPPNK